ncbi:heavy metal translocating P-type ATPase [Thermoflavimicrobium dichotomicum]|uniref:Cd2+/Zn2+-exporting ATPase n=1 Tax=Thermoflavimicrobium dichotomicum TaxID=46223 RepID=A0A1I3LL88_9BACL|nr:heavy metal translocating P-type ATPase [Thermoflavimicrobium dichotomicum]SFI85473.1 Cd2+/Zn2+-exporting ATPase [Thermoflavimicrobium dichotomicum]
MNALYPLEKKIQPLETRKARRSVFIEKCTQHGEMIAAMSSGILVLLAYLWGNPSSYLSTVLFLLAYVIGGFAKAKEGIQTLVHEKELDVNLLMIFAAIGAAMIGYWLEGSMLIFIFAVSGALESYTVAKSERDLSNLIKMKPETARILDEHGQEREVRIEELKKDDLMIVRPGERIAADGIVQEGFSSVDQSMITGEPLPAEKEPNDEVFAGTINGSGSLVVKVTRAGEESVFAKIIRHIEQARNEVPVTQTRIERLEKVYAKAVLGITALLLVLPHYLLGWNWSETVYRAMVFLVVASPCALVASIMPAVLSAISNGARKGILFKSGYQLEMLSDARVVAFDKTGTLTQGKPKVTDFLVFQEMARDELLAAVGSIESLSEHPIAQAIVRFAQKTKEKWSRPSELQAITGWGVKAKYQGEIWRIGKPKMFGNMDGEISQVVEKMEQEGKTVVLVEKTGKVVGLIALQDTVRPEAKAIVQQLKQMGLKVAMLTGDQQVTAEAIAKEVGIDLVYSDCLPEDKVSIVKDLRERFGKVVMVGDGVNDAPALATASIGVAMGGAGSDVALETADLVLMNDDLDRIPQVLRLGKRVQRIVKQNMALALTVICLLILANFLQVMTLPFGVIGHEGSTLLVILNGLRLLR